MCLCNSARSLTCRVLDTILTWAVSPFVLGALCIILAFLLALTQGQRAAYKLDKDKVRSEFEQFRQEVKAKVSDSRGICLLGHAHPACFCQGGRGLMDCAHVSRAPVRRRRRQQRAKGWRLHSLRNCAYLILASVPMSLTPSMQCRAS